MLGEPRSAPSLIRRDRFYVWPLLTAIGVPFLVGVVCAFIPMAVPMALVLWAIVWGAFGFGAVIAAVTRANRGSWKAAGSLALLPLAIVVTSLFPRTFFPLVSDTGNRIWFWVNRAGYEKQVLNLPQSNGLRFIRFPGRGFMLDPDEIVYDESDEIALPPGQQSQSWRDRVGPTSEFFTCRYGQFRLYGHYYMVGYTC